MKGIKEGHYCSDFALLRPSIVSGNRSEDSKRSDTFIEKRLEHIFICQQVAPACPAWQARSQSHPCKKCLCSSSSSFPPTCLFWSYRPLWVVVIGRAVCLLGEGLKTIVFEILSLTEQAEQT